MPELQDITKTLHALVKAMSDAHSGDRAEAYAIARAIVAAISAGKVPLVQMEDP